MEHAQVYLQWEYGGFAVICMNQANPAHMTQQTWRETAV
jgi:hypothetical protein